MLKRALPRTTALVFGFVIVSLALHSLLPFDSATQTEENELTGKWKKVADKAVASLVAAVNGTIVLEDLNRAEEDDSDAHLIQVISGRIYTAWKFDIQSLAPW